MDIKDLSNDSSNLSHTASSINDKNTSNDESYRFSDYNSDKSSDNSQFSADQQRNSQLELSFSTDRSNSMSSGNHNLANVWTVNSMTKLRGKVTAFHAC